MRKLTDEEIKETLTKAIMAVDIKPIFRDLMRKEWEEYYYAPYFPLLNITIKDKKLADMTRASVARDEKQLHPTYVIGPPPIEPEI